ncbi:unnamed protein product [Cylicocyclus nassatus]|uniref:C2H2-type domain-containing protein n=1 Tax=Cylicocyclus nassatus TaxID=53992 RepID=A0AA36GT31_CYLNA|nr:unnamed protein product [Cylicocyclus nassatus]
MKSYGYCHICGGGPFLLGSLYTHLRNVHKCSAEDITEVQQRIRRALYGPGSNCDLCGKLYHSKCSLRKHKKDIHKQVCEPRKSVPSTIPTTSTPTKSLPSTKPRNRVVCPRCDLVCNTYSDFAEHCQEKHHEEADFTIHREIFSSWTLFKTWMTEMERDSPSRLVACSGRRITRGAIRTYRCRYAYLKNAVPAQNQGKRQQKHCPSYAKVLKRDDEPSESSDDSDMLDLRSDSFSPMCYELGNQEIQKDYAFESEENDEKEEEREPEEEPKAKRGKEHKKRTSKNEEKIAKRDGDRSEEHEEGSQERCEQGGNEEPEKCKSEAKLKEEKSEEKCGRGTCEPESLAESPNLFYMW